MKTRKQIDTDLIEYYKIRVKELEGQNEKLREKVHRMNAEIKTSPSDKWYLQYLMKANASLERECDERQTVVEKYQQFFAKYGHFYHRLEKDIHRKELELTNPVVE
jgi:Skp family chaperone for outer membrane proteins